MRAMRTVAHGSWSELLIQSLASSVKLVSACAPAPRAVATRLSASGRRPDRSSLGSATSTGSKTRTMATPAQRRWSRANSQCACSLSSSERTAGTGVGNGHRVAQNFQDGVVETSEARAARDRGRDELAVGGHDDVGLRGQPGLVQRVDGRQLLRGQAQEVVGPAAVDVGVQGAQVVTLRASGAIGQRRFRKLVGRDRVGARAPRRQQRTKHQHKHEPPGSHARHGSVLCHAVGSSDPGSLIPFAFSWYAPSG